MKTIRIGIFDSGLGGLTVLKELLCTVPDAEYIYFGDTARVPYGTKSKETITRFSEENIRFLMAHDIDLVIAACHTASSLAIDAIDSKFSIPIFGVVKPGALQACTSSSAAIGIIGTRSTIDSQAYQKQIQQIKPDLTIISQACPLFVPLIEEGWIDGNTVKDIASHYLAPLLESKIDTLVLGCTHYPVLKPLLIELCPSSIQIINPAVSLAEQVRNEIESNNITAKDRIQLEDRVQYYVSDDPEKFKNLAKLFLGFDLLNVQKVTEKEFLQF